ncbi:TPA: helix-turn-helix domain-containing protein [Neisseria gonorrhoeae]
MEKTSLFGKRLKEERIKLGLNQAEAAEKCGFSREMRGKWERGENRPSSEKLFSFSKIGIDIDYVMHGRRGETAAMPSESLSAEEKELLALFRQLGSGSRKELADYAAFKLVVEKKAQTALGKVSNG